MGKALKLRYTALTDAQHQVVEPIDRNERRFMPVSYTHLDVYKRQAKSCKVAGP